METVNQITSFLAKLAACLLIMIFFEGILTYGGALVWQEYGVFAWIVQVCILILCIRAASVKWFTQ